MKKEDFNGLTMEEAIEKLNELSVSNEPNDIYFIIDMWNEAVAEGVVENEVMDISEENLNIFYPTAADFAQAVSWRQQFCYADCFFYITPTKEPISFTYIDDENSPIYLEALAKYLLKINNNSEEEIEIEIRTYEDVCNDDYELS